MAIQLKRVDTSEEIFDEILRTMASRVVRVPSINPYSTGYPRGMSKKLIVYDGGDYLIMQEYLMLHFASIPAGKEVTDWKQIKVRRTRNVDAWQDSIDGPRATRYMTELLLKHYSKDELAECYRAHEAAYDAKLIQIHANITLPNGTIEGYSNCFKYDINGAHQDALMEIFPKAADDIQRLYDGRKEKPIYKSYVNYFVGDMCRHGHRATYNWIVQRTTRKLREAINSVGGLLIYANTDGFIVFEPARELPTSKALGAFKLEYRGRVYMYKGANHLAIEMSDHPDKDKRITGSVRLAVRDHIDLAHGKVVKYDNVRTTLHNVAGEAITFNDIKNVRVKEAPIYENTKDTVFLKN